MDTNLAQINIGRLRAAPGDPQVAEFINAIDEMNLLAESSPGFVWRYRTDAGNALDVRAYPDPLVIVNVSVWRSAETLKDYVYRSMHAKFYARRAAWFDKMEEPQFALWWILAGTRPTIEEGIARLDHRRRHGDTPYAFSFKQTFSADESLAARPQTTA